MLPDVAQPRGAQQRVANRVQQHVGIRMAFQPLGVGDIDPADHQLLPGDKGMHVEALPYSHAFPATIASASARSSGWVTLRFLLLPATSRGLTPICSIALPSSVTAPSPRCSPSPSSPPRNLCAIRPPHIRDPSPAPPIASA